MYVHTDFGRTRQSLLQNTLGAPINFLKQPAV